MTERVGMVAVRDDMIEPEAGLGRQPATLNPPVVVEGDRLLDHRPLYPVGADQLDLSQLDRRGLDGIWVVSGWRNNDGDSRVTAWAAAPWDRTVHFDAALTLDDQGLERVVMAADSLQLSCHPNPAAADAAALAASIQSDPDLVATAPMEVTIGGIAGLQMDLTLAPAASACPEDRKGNEPMPADRIRGTGFPLELGSRMRLYLVEVPQGSATRILAFAVVAGEARFDAVMEAAAPIVESVQFHTDGS